MPSKANYPGAFSPYTCEIENNAQNAFNEAMKEKEILGVIYTPVAVSRQVIAGLNYNFFCNTEAVTRYPITGAAIVSIYKPLEGNTHIIHIQDL